ncbi:MAG: Ig-like domain-containing protein, partial [Lachnospiraceae bacterium]
MSGTSQATPVVSGIAALLWNSVEGGTEPHDKVDNLLKLMDKSCDKVTGSGLGKGVVNLTKALGLKTVTAAPAKPVFTLKAGTIVTDKAIDQTTKITAGAGNTIYYSVDGKNITYKNGTLSANAIKYTLNEAIVLNNICNASGKVTLKAIAINENNQLASAVTSVSYTLKPKYASTLTISSATGNTTVAKGKTLKLTATLSPAYVTDKNLEWKVEGTADGVTVKSGTVTVKSTSTASTCTIRVTAKGSNGTFSGATDTITLNIQETTNPITTIKLNEAKAVSKVNVESSVNSTVTVTKKDKSNAKATDILWSSSDISIATVSAKDNTLTITGQKAGKVKITGVAKDGFGKSISFTVTVVQPVKAISISPALGSEKVAAGGTINLVASVEPENATNKGLVWSSDNNLVKVSSSGKVTVGAKASGNATITAKAKDGSDVSRTYVITIIPSKITKIQVGQKTVNIFRKTNNFGAPTSATVNVTADGSNWIVTSGSPDLVTAQKSGSNVKVTATGKGIGTATITVQSTDGTNKKQTFKVTVSNPATALHLAPEKGRSYVVAYKKTLKLTAVFETSLGSIDSKAKNVKWTSLTPSILSVDQKGNVKALTSFIAKGQIKAETTDGSGLSAIYNVYTCAPTAYVYLLNANDGQLYSNKNNIIQKGKSIPYYILELSSSSDLDNYVSKERDYKVNKRGLAVAEGVYNGNSYLRIYGNEIGTYTVTISYTDGSTAKKSFTFKVVP